MITDTKFKAGDKIKIGKHHVHVVEVYPDTEDQWHGFVKFMREDGIVDYMWESCCQLDED